MKNFKIIVILLGITLVSVLSGCSKDPFTTEYTNIMLDKFVFPREETVINVEELVVYYNETETEKLFFYEITFNDDSGEWTLIYTYKLNIFDTVFTHDSGQNIPEFESNYSKYKDAVKGNNKKVYDKEELQTLIADAFERKNF